MLARLAQRLTDALARVPWPSTIIGLLLIAIVGLAMAGSTWPPLGAIPPSSPLGVVAITPDDPAAASPVPVQPAGR